MSVKVGIPRALLYHIYYPMWRSFLEQLGAEVVTSHETTKGIIDAGVSATVDEACFPVKVFFGHVLDLKDRVDFLFMPRLVSVEPKAYICPKFMGLPDMIRNSIQGLPPMMDACVDLSHGVRRYAKWVRETGRTLTRNSLRILKADLTSRRVLGRFNSLLRAGHLPEEALAIMGYSPGGGAPGHDVKREAAPATDSSRRPPLRILVAGHPYIIYDDYMSMGVIRKLTAMGVHVITPEMLPQAVVERASGKLPKKLFWTLGRRILGAAYHFFDAGGIDGCLHVTSFGCGPDSLVGELMENEAKRTGRIPFATITVDEHTGEAGVVTRLEAFVDMLERRREGHGGA